MEKREQRGFPYEQACIALFVCLLLLMLAAFLQGVMEAMGAFMFAVFILWQVVRGLVIKRYFWQIPDEKVSFWSLLAALALGGGMLFLCLQRAAGV